MGVMGIKPKENGGHNLCFYGQKRVRRKVGADKRNITITAVQQGGKLWQDQNGLTKN
jgi:hypothetical protein